MSEHFDHYQFEKPYANACSVDSQIAWSDYEFMSQHAAPASRNPRWIPAWASSDQKFQMVLAQRAWWFAGNVKKGMFGAREGKGNSRVPEELAKDLAGMVKMVNAMVSKQKKISLAQPEQQSNHAEHLAAVKLHGWLPLQCSIAYRAYRLCQDSPAIAEALKISPPVVRQILVSLNKAARFLGYETFAPHWTVGLKNPHAFRSRKSTPAVNSKPTRAASPAKLERAALKAAGICTCCKKVPAAPFAECSKCRAHSAELMRDWIRRKKAA